VMQSLAAPCDYSHGPASVTLAAIPAGGYDESYKATGSQPGVEKDAVADIGNDNNRTSKSQPWVSHRST